LGGGWDGAKESDWGGGRVEAILSGLGEDDFSRRGRKGLRGQCAGWGYEKKIVGNEAPSRGCKETLDNLKRGRVLGVSHKGGEKDSIFAKKGFKLRGEKQKEDRFAARYISLLRDVSREKISESREHFLWKVCQFFTKEKFIKEIFKGGLFCRGQICRGVGRRKVLR